MNRTLIRKLAALILALSCVLCFAAAAQVHNHPATKEEKKQQKAQKKYAKAQKKAQRKMEEYDRKHTHDPNLPKKH